MGAMRPALALILLLAGCAEPRWSLWELRDGEAIRREAGLERLVCETLRDRAERDAQAARERMAQIQRELVMLGGKAGRVTMPPRYRCRPDGEDYG